jgi:hypothetical protein
MSLGSVIRNYKKNGLKYFTPKRAWVWIRSNIRILTGYRLREKDSLVFSEIIMYKKLTCPDCVELGYCRVCECPINELFTAMDVGCSDGKFPAFHVKPSWKYIFNKIYKGDFKEALKEFKNRKHWRKYWKEYKESEGVHFMKLYT